MFQLKHLLTNTKYLQKNQCIKVLSKKFKIQENLILNRKYSKPKSNTEKVTKTSTNTDPCENKTDVVRRLLFVPVQVEKFKAVKKVSVIGATGNVGSTVAFNLLLKNICDEVVLADIPNAKNKLCSDAVDYQHGLSFAVHPKIKVCLDLENTRDSDVIIMCQGMGKLKKEQTRLHLLDANSKIFKEQVPKLASRSPEAVFIVVSNPVDILSYVTWKYSGFDKNRIIGTGTELDTARFRYLIGKRLGINPTTVNAWIIGEHGETSVPVWSSANVAGTRLRELDPKIGTDADSEDWNSLHRLVVRSAPTIVKLKGYTNFAISIVAISIADAVLRNAKTVHAVCTNVQGTYNIQEEMFTSLPCVIGNRGVESIVKQCLDKTEVEKFTKSVQTLHQYACKQKLI